MGKKNRKAEDILRDALKIKDVMHKKIVEKEIKIGRRLTQDEKQKVKNGIKTKYRIAKAVGLGLIVLGIGSGVSNALPKGNDIPDERTVAENSAERDNFVKEIQFDTATATITVKDLEKENEEIRQYIEDKVNSFETNEEALDYVKQLYINEYNLNKGKNCTIDQLDLMRYRDCEPEWIINATINDNGHISSEAVYKDIWGCHSCKYVYYNKYEGREEDFMEDLAPVLDAGITNYASMNNEGVSKTLQNQRREKFVNMMAEYVSRYKGKTYQMIMEDIESQKSNDDNEIGG